MGSRERYRRRIVIAGAVKRDRVEKIIGKWAVGKDTVGNKSLENVQLRKIQLKNSSGTGHSPKIQLEKCHCRIIQSRKINFENSSENGQLGNKSSKNL